MGLIKKIFATGLADALFRQNFENIGNRQWEDNELVMTSPWVYVCGQVGQWGDKYEAQVSTGAIPGAYNSVGNKWVTIWHSKKQKTYEEALGNLTKHVRISQNEFPHLIFLRAIFNNSHKEPKYQEFLNNEWVAHPYNHHYSDDWEPLRLVVKRCSSCGYFDDGLDSYLDDGDDSKLFSYEEKVNQCRNNHEFKCLQFKSRN